MRRKTSFSQVLILLPLLLGAASQEEKPPQNLAIPDDLPKEARRLFEDAKAAYDEARKEGEGATRKMEKAVSKLHRARRKAKDFHLPYFYLGAACQITRDLDEAEKFLKKAIDLHENFHEAYVELGDTYFWKRDWKKAVETYDKAIEIAPDYSLAYQRRLVTYCRQRKFEQAKADVEKWKELDPENKEPEFYLRYLDKEIGGYDLEESFSAEREHYILLTNTSQEVADEMADQAEMIFRLYTSRFPKLDKGADKFPIIYFKNKDDYFAYGGSPGTLGYYNRLVRKLVLFDTGDAEQNLTVLYHEGFHQYLHYYLEGAPQWFNEGHGDFFGACRKIPGKSQAAIRPSRMRLGGIQYGIKSGQVQPLSRLLTMTQAELYDRRTIGMNYAQSWSFVYFLWHGPKSSRGKYFPVLRKYFKELRAGRGLKEAYKRSFGKQNMKKMDEEWRTFIMGTTLGSAGG